jgi:hypothetical protein
MPPQSAIAAAKVNNLFKQCYVFDFYFLKIANTGPERVAYTSMGRRPMDQIGN